MQTSKNEDVNLNPEVQDAIQDRPRRNGWGGARRGSGPKPGVATQVKRDLHQRMADDAEYAFDLVAKIARDEQQTAKTRLQAADLLMQRAWGKATARVEYAPAEPPQVDHTLQAALLADPEACELAATLDARLSLPSANHRSEPE